MRRGAALALLLAAGCAPLAAGPNAPPLALTWKTLRAEQRVRIDVALADGQHEQRTMRAVLAVERPDRFRLRALGPAGIALFDVVYVGGRVTVLQAIRDPRASALGPVIASMAGDLAAAYDLAPRPTDRRLRRDGAVQIVEEPQRTVRERGRRIDVENRARRYTVVVESVAVELDAALDPQLFAE